MAPIASPIMEENCWPVGDARLPHIVNEAALQAIGNATKRQNVVQRVCKGARHELMAEILDSLDRIEETNRKLRQNERDRENVIPSADDKSLKYGNTSKRLAMLRCY